MCQLGEFSLSTGLLRCRSCSFIWRSLLLSIVFTYAAALAAYLLPQVDHSPLFLILLMAGLARSLPCRLAPRTVCGTGDALDRLEVCTLSYTGDTSCGTYRGCVVSCCAGATHCRFQTSLGRGYIVLFYPRSSHSRDAVVAIGLISIISIQQDSFGVPAVDGRCPAV